MAARVVTVAFQGVEAIRVDVQVQFTSGESKFFLVGMGDKAISESRERVRAAFSGLGLSLPARRIIANLAPADLPKEGSHYDLPIALGLMAAIGAPSRRMRWAALPYSANWGSTDRSRRWPACCRRRSAPMRATKG